MFDVSNSSTAPRSNSSSFCWTRRIRYCRRRSKSTRFSQSTPMTPGAGLVATGNSSMACSLAVGRWLGIRVRQRVLQVRPVADEAVRVSAGRLGGLGLEPPHAPRAEVAEAVDAADPRPGHVARPQLVGRAVER